MEESKLKSKCYFCKNKFSHKKVIFGFDPAQTQICHAKNDTNVQAPDVTMIKDGIVPSEAEQITDNDDTSIISTTTSSQQMAFRYTYYAKIEQQERRGRKNKRNQCYFHYNFRSAYGLPVYYTKIE